MSKEFIAVSSIIQNNKLTYLCNSKGKAIYSENGLSFETAIDFLFDLIHYRNKSNTVFISYHFAQTYEYLFASLSDAIKDKLFKSEFVKRKLKDIETDNEQINATYYQAKKDSQDFELADFERFVNQLRLQELLEVKIGDYQLQLIQGKVLTIRKNKKSISIYDGYGFFKPKALKDACAVWLDGNYQFLDKSEFDDIEILKEKASFETHCISKLFTKLAIELEKIDIKPSRWFGASGIASYCLNKIKAKDSYHSYKNKWQMSKECFKAMRQSFYGGRSEQFKLGTIKDVKIYDINSAYAYAISFLPVFLRKPTFTRQFTENFFSIWFCEYDFTNLDSYFGYLPNREFNQSVKYKLKGKSYFWFPEVKYILDNFPECIKIHKGFVWEYEKAKFTNYITDLYRLRVELQKQNNPLEKILKLTLSSFYGKFCQTEGQATFYNLFYAGFITSLTRTMLLQATKGYEKETICFQTDAIHTTANLSNNVNLSVNLGEYKLSKYDRILYLDNGIYQCFSGKEIIKTKTRGFANFDFESAVESINERFTFSANNKLFIGHNLETLKHLGGGFRNAEYLSVYENDIEIESITRERNSNRIFESKDIDFTKEFLDSKINTLYGGKESALYEPFASEKLKEVHKAIL